MEKARLLSGLKVGLLGAAKVGSGAGAGGHGGANSSFEVNYGDSGGNSGTFLIGSNGYQGWHDESFTEDSLEYVSSSVVVV